MPYTLDCNDKLGIIELVMSGNLTKEEMLETTIEVVKYQEQLGRLYILLDATYAYFDVPLVEIFDLPDKHYIEQNANPQNMLALIPPPSTKGRKDAEFYMNACVNRGRIVQLFDSRDKAIEWLTSQNQYDQ